MTSRRFEEFLPNCIETIVKEAIKTEKRKLVAAERKQERKKQRDHALLSVFSTYQAQQQERERNEREALEKQLTDGEVRVMMQRLVQSVVDRAMVEGEEVCKEASHSSHRAAEAHRSPPTAAVDEGRAVGCEREVSNVVEMDCSDGADGLAQAHMDISPSEQPAPMPAPTGEGPPEPAAAAAAAVTPVQPAPHAERPVSSVLEGSTQITGVGPTSESHPIPVSVEPTSESHPIPASVEPTSESHPIPASVEPTSESHPISASPSVPAPAPLAMSGSQSQPVDVDPPRGQRSPPALEHEHEQSVGLPSEPEAAPTTPANVEGM